MAKRLRGRQDDHRAPRSPHSSLRYHRDRQRQLAIAKPCLITASPSLATAPYRPRSLAAAPPLHPYLQSLKLLHTQVGQNCTPIEVTFASRLTLPDCFAFDKVLAPNSRNRFQDQHPPPPRLQKGGKLSRLLFPGGRFGRRSPASGGQNCTPNNSRFRMMTAIVIVIPAWTTGGGRYGVRHE